MLSKKVFVTEHAKERFQYRVRGEKTSASINKLVRESRPVKKKEMARFHIEKFRKKGHSHYDKNDNAIVLYNKQSDCVFVCKEEDSNLIVVTCIGPRY